MFSRWMLFIPLALFLMLVAVFTVLQGRQAAGEFDPAALPSALVGQPLPEFHLTDLMGNELDVSSLPKGPYLLNVWATWCVSCKAEHPYLNKLAASGIKIIGLNYKDERDKALRWLQRLGDPYETNIYDPQGSLGLNLGVYGAPETYFVDAKGIVRYRQVGVLNERVWRKNILPLNLDW